MIRDRVVFVIPGYRHSPSQKAYKEIEKILKKERYTPRVVSVKWSWTISENADLFLESFNKVDAKEKYILGFSFGAMIAFLASTKVHVDGLILCSLSPYFHEDVVLLKEPKTKTNSDAMFLDFLTLKFKRLVKQIKSDKVLFLYGEREAASLVKRVVETFGSIPSKEKSLIQIPKTEHTIGSRRYLETIHKVALFLQ